MIRLVGLVLFVALGGLGSLEADTPVPPSFEKENLVAWCIVPFDAKKRGPEERARMLKELGLTRSAYDWRQNHIPEFEKEILAYQRHGIEMFAFWSGHEEAFRLFKKYGIHPQIWKTVPSPEGETQEERVSAAVRKLEPLVKRAGEAGCAFGLYNHGGWGGEPENLVAICKAFRERGDSHVGIVYNFHHAHDRIDSWAADFEVMKPFLLCLNLNGMVPGGDREGKKILRLGGGTKESDMINAVLRSGYEGPIGILDHRNETDTRETLLENLEGLEQVLETLKEPGK
ncbi:MAG: TIM barrel protein [Verrucomicrobiales bacterium]|jgi:hypothetical protein|nr:TIM barrel protein [Verrucomicrobiales bacterium]